MIIAELLTSAKYGNNLVVHHTAPTALSVQQFLTQNGMTLVPHPPYLPDLTPFISPDEKNSHRERFCLWKRWNKKWQMH